MWYEITYPFPNSNGCAVEVWEWISNFLSTIYDECNYLSRLGLLNYVNKKWPQPALDQYVANQTKVAYQLLIVGNYCILVVITRMTTIVAWVIKTTKMVTMVTRTAVKKMAMVITRIVRVSFGCRFQFNTLRPKQNGRHVADDIFQRIFLVEMFAFRLNFHWSFFLWVQLTICQHWFGRWLGTDYHLNQRWLDYRRINALLGLNELPSNGSWCMGIKGEMSGTVCVTFTWDMYIYMSCLSPLFLLLFVHYCNLMVCVVFWVGKWQSRGSTGMFGNLMAIYHIMLQFIQNHSRFVMLMIWK